MVMRGTRRGFGGWPLWSGLGIGVLGLAAWPHPATGQDAPPVAKIAPEAVTFFESKVRPVLLDSCVSCHGKDIQLAGLRLDSREAMLKGGNSGPALVPGDPEKSLLIQVVRHTGKIKMPQGGKLKDEQITALTEWVRIGAPWPVTPSLTPSPNAAKGGAGVHWSFRPVQKPTPPKVKTAKWALNPLDTFILAKLESQGLQPNAMADKRTQLRRVTFDLTGLPPTYADMQAFLADKSPDAYAKAVDRLLDSPRYGERWARLWLDVARYADTKGYVFEEDRNYYNAYTYRDWVIRSLNEDLPYDRFIMEQLAADRMPEVQNGDDKRPLAALGFLTIGRRFLNSAPDIIDDRIDVTMRGFQGMTVACARCHDHKFDPIPAQDYYSLYGVFNSSIENAPPISPKNISEPYVKHDAEVQDLDGKVRHIITTQTKRLRRMMADPNQVSTLTDAVKKSLQAVREEQLPGGDNLKTLMTAFEPDERQQLVQSQTRLEELRKSYPPKPEFAMAMADSPSCGNVRVFKRGNPGNPGEEAPRRFLVALTPPGQERAPWTEGSGRLELAKAIASKDNPLTARVMVNRVWLNHFGAGLVRTPSDFGKQGEKPTHPELLDYLSSWFMENGWSLKKLHKLMVTSATYRQSSEISPKMAIADAENRLWGRMNRKRLDLEQMRDSLLFASGKLDTAQLGGKSEDLWKAPFTGRRAVYGFVERQNLPQIFKTFDFASPDSTNAGRFRTTVPQQALFLMNNSFAIEQARTVATVPEIEKAADTATQVRRLYLRIYNRLPDPDELAVGVTFLSQPDPEPAARPVSVWQYGYGGYDAPTNKVSFTVLTHFTGQAWQVGPQFPDPKLGHIVLNPEGGHPGNDNQHAAIRRWTAPQNMTVSIAGRLKQSNAEGDGVRALIIHSRLGKVRDAAAHNNETPIEVTKVEMRQGESLDFIVEPVGGPAFDSFNWNPVVRVVGKTTGQSTWSAKRDFGGPLPAPLNRREQYAQALLMTNEFLFVD